MDSGENGRLTGQGLLKRIPREPPVRVAISVLRLAMLSGLVTSRVMVSMPFSAKLPSVLSERAVAKTRKPLAANSKANALPAPPWEHLIMES